MPSFRSLGLIALLFITPLATRLCAQTTLYWDPNGATAGSGGSATGTWGTDNFWSTDSTGASATGAYVADSNVVFSAGTDSTGGTVTLSSDQSVASLTFEEGSITLTGSTLTLTGTGGVITTAVDTTINSTLAGSVGLTKNGTATLTLGGTNTYTGGTTINAGTLQIASASNLGSDAIVFAGGTLKTSAAVISTHDVTLSSTGTIDTNGFDSAFGGTFSGAGGLTKSGGGVLTLAGINTYTGATTVNAGTIRLSGVGRLPDTTALTLAAGTTFDLNHVYDTIGSLASASSTSSVTLGSALLTVGDSTSTTFAGIISGTGGVTKTGSGVLTLSNNNNSYTGTTTISAGTLQIGAGGSTGAIASNNIVNNGTLAFNRTITYTYSGSISGTGNLTKSGTNTLTLTGNISYTGTTTIDAGTLTISPAAGASFTSTSGNFSIGASNGGATLRNTGPAVTITGVVDLANAVGSSILIDSSGTGALTFTSDFTASGAGARTLRLLGTTSGTISGAIVDNSTSNKTSVNKTGSGSWTLSGTNTYTGTTLVNAGTLAITGSLASGSAVSVNSGATLRGTGTIGGTLAINSGGTLAPGSSPGTLSSGATTWNGGGIYQWEINNATGTAGTNSDLLNVTGALTIAATSGSPFTINLTSLTAGNAAGQVVNFDNNQSYSYTIASASGGISGFDTTAFTISTTGFQNDTNGGSWSLSQVGNNLNLNFTPIPEPSTYAVIVGSATLALAAWRRRRLNRARTES